MNIYLIGYRCSGKTSVGKNLAGRLKRPFVDTDEEIQRRHNASIADLVNQHGWDHFRELETGTLKHISRRENCVAATGGGIVLDPTNISHMRFSGFVVWLKASRDTIAGRLAKDSKTTGQRPPLTAQGGLHEISQMLAEREDLYQKAADLAVSTDHITVEQVSAIIMQRIASRSTT